MHGVVLGRTDKCILILGLRGAVAFPGSQILTAAMLVQYSNLSQQISLDNVNSCRIGSNEKLLKHDEAPEILKQDTS
jgi:hypothetical protein